MESQGRSAQHGGACARAAHAHNVSTWRGVSIAPALVASGRLLELERQTSASLTPEHLLTGKWYRPHRDESAGMFQTPAGRQLLLCLLLLQPRPRPATSFPPLLSVEPLMASEDDPFTPAQLREILGAEGDVAREGASNSARRDGQRPPQVSGYMY